MIDYTSTDLADEFTVLEAAYMIADNPGPINADGQYPIAVNKIKDAICTELYECQIAIMALLSDENNDELSEETRASIVEKLKELPDGHAGYFDRDGKLVVVALGQPVSMEGYERHLSKEELTALKGKLKKVADHHPFFQEVLLYWFPHISIDDPEEAGRLGYSDKDSEDVWGSNPNGPIGRSWIVGYQTSEEIHQTIKEREATIKLRGENITKWCAAHNLRPKAFFPEKGDKPQANNSELESKGVGMPDIKVVVPDYAAAKLAGGSIPQKQPDQLSFVRIDYEKEMDELLATFKDKDTIVFAYRDKAAELNAGGAEFARNTTAEWMFLVGIFAKKLLVKDSKDAGDGSRKMRKRINDKITRFLRDNLIDGLPENFSIFTGAINEEKVTIGHRLKFRTISFESLKSRLETDEPTERKKKYASDEKDRDTKNKAIEDEDVDVDPETEL